MTLTNTKTSNQIIYLLVILQSRASIAAAVSCQTSSSRAQHRMKKNIQSHSNRLARMSLTRLSSKSVIDPKRLRRDSELLLALYSRYTAALVREQSDCSHHKTIEK